MMLLRMCNPKTSQGGSSSNPPPPGDFYRITSVGNRTLRTSSIPPPPEELPVGRNNLRIITVAPPPPKLRVIAHRRLAVGRRRGSGCSSLKHGLEPRHPRSPQGKKLRADPCFSRRNRNPAVLAGGTGRQSRPFPLPLPLPLTFPLPLAAPGALPTGVPSAHGTRRRWP